MKPSTSYCRKSSTLLKPLFSFLVFTIFILGSSTISAQAPVNDLCDDAIAITCGDTVSGDTTMSTNAGDPMDDCGTTNGAPGNWYNFAGNGDIISLSLCGSTYDTKIRVYSGDCTTLTCIGGNDDSCGLQSEFTFLSSPGTNYLIYVFGFGANVGTYNLNMSCITPGPIPANDECISATDVTVNPTIICDFTTSGTIESATVSNEPNSCNPDSRDVWYSFVALNTSHTIDLLNVQGNNLSIDFEVLEGSCGALTNFSCSPAGTNILNGFIIGNTYFVRVYNDNDDIFANTTFELCISSLVAATTPSNDECQNALAIPVNPDDTCTLFTSATIAGSTESGQTNTCVGTADDDVWFEFVATSDRHYVTLSNIVGSTTDLNHVVYEGTDCGTLTEITCSDINTSTYFGLTVGTTYTVRVYSATDIPFRNTTFDICVATQQICVEARPFCSLDGLIFENVSNDTTPDPSIDYECLNTQPNPVYFFLQIDQGGDLEFEIAQNTMFDTNGNPTGDPLDVDFIAWGPFTDVNAGCGNLNTTTSIDCSYSTAAIENFSIPGAVTGEIYILLITNFNRNPGFISLQQTNAGSTGAGSTDCSIVNECSIQIEGGDQEVCGLSEINLTTTTAGPIETYQWFKDGVAIAAATNDSLLVSEDGTYRVEVDGTVCDDPGDDEVEITFTAICPAVCSIVDFEENFGTGTGLECDLAGAATTYLCWDGTGQMDGGEYIVSNTANGVNDGWHLNMEDHTEGDVDGRMLFINADDNQTGEFYRRTITLNPDTDYEFSSWITTVYDTDTGICPGTGVPSNVIFRIEDPAGTLIQETNTGDIQNGPEPNWQEFFIAFNTGINTDIQLVLINNTTGACGNDLAIDDITLTLENTQPIIVTPEDLSLCDENGNGTATFDLTTVTDTVLDGQNPNDFELSFHENEMDASSGLNAIVTPNTYLNSSNPQTIYVRVQTAGEPSCFSTVDFDLLVDEVIALNVSLPSSFDLCSTDPFPTLDGTPQNPAVDLSLVTYEWTDNAGNVLSTDAIYTPTFAGTFRVRVNLAPCSEEIDASIIRVTTLPELDLGTDEVLCDGGMFEIIPVITGTTTGISYTWSTGENTPTITVDVSGTYDLTIMVGPCEVTDSMDIVISDPIEVEVTEDFTTCPNMPQTIMATASDPTATFQWFENGIAIPEGTEASLTFTIESGTSGTQVYSVVATSGECTGENAVNVSLYAVDNCIISQGISPNGSPGLNDSLDLEFLSDRTGGITNLQIFNRLGTLVFERGNYVNEWMGQDKNGNELPTGTYYYVIDFLSEDPVYGAQASGWIYLNKESN